MSWRPEGWQNPFDARYIVKIKGHKVCYHSLFEAGADAMLEALEKESVYAVIKDTTFAQEVRDKNGCSNKIIP